MIVQGDTTTAFCAALAAFYAGIRVGHVEAGLRTGDPALPFPEEINRRLVAVLASLALGATCNAEALIAEGIAPERITVTGNTVIDALLSMAARPMPEHVARSLPSKRAPKRLLVTMHRRETQGEAQRALCRMFAEVARRPDTEVLFPVHANPSVHDTVVVAELQAAEGVLLTGPLDYRAFVHALRFERRRGDRQRRPSGGGAGLRRASRPPCATRLSDRRRSTPDACASPEPIRSRSGQRSRRFWMIPLRTR